MSVEHFWGKAGVKMAAKSAKMRKRGHFYLHPEECDARQEINCGLEVLKSFRAAGWEVILKVHSQEQITSSTKCSLKFKLFLSLQVVR